MKSQSVITINETQYDRSAIARSQEIAVIQSKRDFEVPPIANLNPISMKTWKIT